MAPCRSRIACLGIGDGFLIALFLAHGDKLDAVIQRLVEAADGVDHLLETLALLHELLRLFGIVPEVGDLRRENSDSRGV